jgi:Phage tail tube protein, GTA-gp10
MSKANKQKGEVTLELGGKKLRLCLTLGSMAEMEDTLGVESLMEVGNVLKKGRTVDIMKVVLALAHGGGHGEVTLEEIGSMPPHIQSISQVIRDCFAAAGFGAPEDNTTGK